MKILIVTAKGTPKHFEPINELALIDYPLNTASKLLADGVVDRAYVSTEDPFIKDLAILYGLSVINRPKELSMPSSLHKDVIKHAVESACTPDDIVAIMLGNTAMISADEIASCFKAYEENSCDSLCTVWKAQDDHPFRAMSITDGYIKPFGFEDKRQSSNRQDYPDVYFYDQGLWMFQAHCAIEQKGPAPWVWLGQRCIPFVRQWVTGRDVHDTLDMEFQKHWVNHVSKNLNMIGVE